MTNRRKLANMRRVIQMELHAIKKRKKRQQRLCAKLKLGNEYPRLLYFENRVNLLHKILKAGE